MKTLLSGMPALAYSWAARATRYARIVAAVSMVVAAAARAGTNGSETTSGAFSDRSERVYQYDLSGPRLGASAGGQTAELAAGDGVDDVQPQPRRTFAERFESLRQAEPRP